MPINNGYQGTDLIDNNKIRESMMKKLLLLSTTWLLLVTGPAHAMLWDFNDGTLQGWALDDSDTGFTLANPGDHALLTDLSSGMSGGLAIAPLAYPQDLSGFPSISWDALLPDDWNVLTAIDPVRLVLSSNTSQYIYTPTLTVDGLSAQAGVWQSWEAPLDGTGWELDFGAESFATVLENATGLAFVLEVTTTTGIEAGIDNVQLVPVPAAVWLFGSGLLGLVAVARRRQS